MGLIKAAMTAVSGTMSDQWKEFFYCDSIPDDILVAQGVKKTGKHSSNHGNDNIITTGSIIAVADGQCMMITDQGHVVDICSVPGEYVYDASTSPSIFSEGLSAGIKVTLEEIKKRISFGGDAHKVQRVYYFNTKYIKSNKFGTPTPVPFRVTYQDMGRSFTVGVRCNGEYTYRITNPALFYTNLCGNISGEYRRDRIDSKLKSEFLSALQPAFGKLSSMGIRYDELPLKTLEICSAMNEALFQQWSNKLGIEITDVSINSVNISKEDEDRIKKFEDMAWNTNPINAAAVMVDAQAEAMKAAAGNSAGAMTGFMGLNMAQQNGGFNAQTLFNAGQQQAAAQTANSWTCSCGTANTGKFCSECAAPKPAPAVQWTCSCGTVNTGKFCSECASPKPVSDSWVCSCGTTNTGKFCSECAKPRR